MSELHNSHLSGNNAIVFFNYVRIINRNCKNFVLFKPNKIKNTMKTAGIILLAVGLLITIFTGFKYVTKEKVVDIGKLEITKDENHFLSWSPLLGIAVMAIGGAVYFYGTKK